MMNLLFKLIYSALLFGIAGVAARELWIVWFDTRVYIGKFDVVSESDESEKDDKASEAFPKRIVAAQTILSQQLTGYQSRHTADAPSDTTYAISGMTPLRLPPEALAGVDITVQNVDLRKLLTSVRRGFLAPNEVSGHVTEHAGSVLAAVDWPRAPRPADGSPALTKFLSPNRGTAQEVAAYVACSISWARAASLQASFAAFPRTQICDFAAVLGDLYAFEEKASTGAGLDDEQTKLVRRRVAALRSHYGASAIFPEIYRLRADLLDLLPEKERTSNELVEAQDDRLRYAMLSSDLRTLPEETKRLAALALARPAILLENGRPKDIRDNWSGLLERHTSEIGAAAAATGIILDNDGPSGTGFIAAPGVLMTAAFVINRAGRPANAEAADAGKPLRLCLGPSQADCGRSFEIGKLLYDGQPEGSSLVLAELKDHDPLLVPPLTFAEPLPAPNAIVGSYAYEIGYPFFDARIPGEFNHRLLGGAPGQKRLMPGRILAFGASRRGTVGPGQAHTLITTDISTTQGTAGGPVLDLQTGRVIGVGYAGQWQGERGKFAYAEPIPRAALDMAVRWTRGEADARPDAAIHGEAPQR